MRSKLSDDKIMGYFSNIDLKFRAIHDKLDLILEQTTKTNGTVRSLEEYCNISRGITIVVSCIVVPILLYLIYIHFPTR